MSKQTMMPPNRISRRQKKWLRGQKNRLAIPWTNETLAEVSLSKPDWHYNLLVFRCPSLAMYRFQRAS